MKIDDDHPVRISFTWSRETEFGEIWAPRLTWAVQSEPADTKLMQRSVAAATVAGAHDGLAKPQRLLYWPRTGQQHGGRRVEQWDPRLSHGRPVIITETPLWSLSFAVSSL